MLGGGLALLHLLCLVIAWEQRGDQRVEGGVGVWPQSENCSGSKGTAAGGYQKTMLLAAGSPEGRAEWAIFMSVTVTYCIAKLGYLPKIYC